jgi:gluconate:H+ symporter, GntP family
MLLLLLLGAILCIIIGTTKLKIHPFIVLFFVAIVFGLSAQMETSKIIESINDGFGKTLGSIGLVIVFGVIMGTFLEKTGAALRITTSILKLTGPQRVPWAMAFMGYIISIPVFADSGFVILNALNKSLSKKAKISMVSTAVALSMGLMATHTMVPPTPGPIAAAGIIGAKIGFVIMFGLIISFLSLIPVVFYCIYIGKKYYLEAKESDISLPETPTEQPSLLKSVLPILIPLLLIVFKSFEEYLQFLPDGFLKQTVYFIGTPVVALFVGLLLAFLLPKKLEKSMLSSDGWVGSSIRDASEILLITGAGGIFGKILQNSGLGDLIGETLSQYHLGLLLPFIIAATIKTAQGSSTIGIITAASIVAPLLPQLGLDTEISKALVVIAIGAGSAVISHVNDSFFWVVTQLTGMSLPVGYRSHSAASALLGFLGLFFSYVFFYILN